MANNINSYRVTVKEIFESLRPKDLTDKALLSITAALAVLLGPGAAAGSLIAYAEKKFQERHVQARPQSVQAPAIVLLGGGDTEAPPPVEKSISLPAEKTASAPLPLLTAPEVPIPSLTAPVEIENGGNTCYLSSLLWCFVLDNPVLERELRAAEKRLDDNQVHLKKIEEIDEVLGLIKEKKEFIDKLRSLAPELSNQHVWSNVNSLDDPKLIFKLELDLYAARGRFQEVEDHKPLKKALINQFIQLIDSYKKGNVLKRKEMRAFRKTLQPLCADLKVDLTHQKDAHSILLPILGMILENSKIGAETNGWDVSLEIPDNGDTVQEGTTLLQLLKNKKWEAAPFPFLCVTLKRFLRTGDVSKKLEGAVEVPEIIEFGRAHFEDGKTTAIYQLKGFVFHEGTIDGGHYTAFVRMGGKYFYLNDLNGKETVQEIDQATFLLYASHSYIQHYELVRT